VTAQQVWGLEFIPHCWPLTPKTRPQESQI
jgi:hypothetical protein